MVDKFIVDRVTGDVRKAEPGEGTYAYTEPLREIWVPTVGAEPSEPAVERRTETGTLEPEKKASNPKDAIGCTKAPLSTVPGQVVFEIGLGLLEGALKYRRHNYRIAGVRAAIYYDAAMRHLMAWWEGQNIDPDSGLNHITKALSCLTVLRDAMIQGKWTDDRPPPSANQEWVRDMNAEAKRLFARCANPLPAYTKEDVK